VVPPRVGGAGHRLGRRDILGLLRDHPVLSDVLAIPGVPYKVVDVEVKR
jgi:hypothetical protein